MERYADMNYSQTASEVIECMAYISRETLQVFPRGIAGGEMGILINLSGSESERNAFRTEPTNAA